MALVSGRARVLAAAACVVSALAGPRTASAQRALGLEDLDGHASPALEARIRALTDSARAVGLPITPLIDKALEGTSKHAPDDRIVAVLQSVLASLRSARRALGANASDAELTTAVTVLRAGVSPDALSNARRQLPGRPLAVPLSVLASLVAAGMPAGVAEQAVVAQARWADDATVLAFGHAVERSLAAGMTPYTAITVATGGGPMPAGGGGRVARPKP